MHTNDVDQEELSARLAGHGQIAAAGIAFNRMGGGSLNELVIDDGRRTELIAGGVGSQSEDQDDDQDDDSVDLVTLLAMVGRQ